MAVSILDDVLDVECGCCVIWELLVELEWFVEV